jgi:hypothetical protein
MAERRNSEREGRDAVSVLDANNGDSGRRVGYSPAPTTVDVANTTVVTPTDRVRWGPIFAGLFAALTSLVVLSLLGLAIGLTSYDAGDPLRNFGRGAGIWGAISAFIAFLIGGWLAARSAPPMGRGNGVLNGAMVWVVAIPLMLYLLGTGLGSLVNTATNAAAAGVAAVAPVAGAAAEQAAEQPGAEATAAAGAGAVTDAAQATASALGDQVTPQTAENVAENASPAAWGTLLALLLGLAAAAIGGMLGAREPRIHTQPLTA